MATYTPEKCNCTIMRSPQQSLWINYCNLHKSAPDLLAACKLMASYGNNFAYRTNEENPYEVLIAAIAKAGGNKK